MTTLIESTATVILLILMILLFSQLLNGSASDWIHSKFWAAPA